MKLTTAQKYSLSKIYATMTDEELNEIGSFDSICQQDNFVFLHIAVRNLEPVGFITLEEDTSEPRVKSAGTTMGVVLNFRGTDVSKELINSANNFFANSSFEQWCYNVNSSNIASKKFAKKHGFTFAWDNPYQKGYEVYLKTNPSLFWK